MPLLRLCPSNRLVWAFALCVLGLASVLPLLVVPSESSAQPPPPDPIFHNGFELSNQAPVADAGSDQSATVGIPLLLDGSGSTDPEGDPLSFAWRVVNRPVNSGAELFDGDQTAPTLVPDRAGEYVVELVVSDSELFSAPDTVTITATGNLSSSAMIGPAGGAVGLPDGASVLIPPNALSSTVSIGITEIPLPPGSVLPPTGVLTGGVYDLTPNNQSFQRPVQIVIPYDPTLLPAGYDEGAIAVYRRETWPEFNRVASGIDSEQPSSDGQIVDPVNRLITVLSTTFSQYDTTGVRSSTQYTPVTVSTANASVIVRRPPTLRTNRAQHFNCTAPTGAPNNTQIALPTRLAADIGGIAIHSTNSGNVNKTFDSELGWATDSCNPYFTHYYIDRNGNIFQVADDLLITQHVAPPAFGLSNSNLIGIELFHNVGEPYDGRQVTALIQLVDYLMDVYTLPRPQRNSSTGIVSRNRVHINMGGDRVLAHAEIVTSKCDPSGTFMDSGFVKREFGGIRCRNPDPRVQFFPLSVGNSRAPALMDLLLDAMAVLDRNAQHTGVINTHGGDSFEVAQAGAAGSITIRQDAALVDTTLGTVVRTRWEENEPALVGPGPLIVAPGDTMNLAGPMHEYTDIIIAGTLNITGNIELRATGSVYVSPLGKIIVRNGRNGGNLTVYSRGTPVLQGLIDSRGEDGIAGNAAGGNGGNVSFIYAAPGVLLVPTLYARGGDADTADVTAPSGGPTGGLGGAVLIEAGTSHVFLGGGVGPIVNNARVPTWRSSAIDPALLAQRWAADYLPPAPPSTLSSFGTMNPANGVRPPITWGANEVGFTRGVLTAGGMGGTGQVVSTDTKHGGPAGHGGSVQITLDAAALLTFRDIDIITGAGIEILTHRFSLPPPAPGGTRLVCPTSGAHGGFGQNMGSSGGNGGRGGNAGAITFTGGVLNPAPASFVDRDAIQGFLSGSPLTTADDNCSQGSTTIGNIIEARSPGGAPLYRLRLNTTRTAVLGGLGGIPSGRPAAGHPGNVGPAGTSAPISGVPVL